MTVQEIRELIGKKTEEINGYLESRDADKAEAALEEKKKITEIACCKRSRRRRGKRGIKRTEAQEGRKAYSFRSKRVESSCKICA